MNLNRRGFLGLLGVGAAAIALRPKFSVLTAPAPLVLEEPPEPISYPKLTGKYSDLSSYEILKELYADDVAFQSTVQDNPFTKFMRKEADCWQGGRVDFGELISA